MVDPLRLKIRPDKKEMYLKTILLGDEGVGKTTLRRRRMGLSIGTSMQDEAKYVKTLGVDASAKVYKVKDRKIVVLVYDPSGSKLFRDYVRTVYKNTEGVILMFDVTNKKSFDDIFERIDDYLKHGGRKDPVVYLVGNKIDLKEKRVIPREKGEELAKELSSYLGYEVPYRETSALTGENVAEMMKAHAIDLSKRILKKLLRFFIGGLLGSPLDSRSLVSRYRSFLRPL